MNELVFVDQGDRKKELYTTSEIIADRAKIERRKVKDTIRKYREELETFGLLASYQAESIGGRPREKYRLNEQQATFLLTLLKNTPVVVEFKKELVRQFYAMRAELVKRQVLRESEKPTRRTLTDAIRDNPAHSPHDFKHYTDLAYKTATGRTAAQLRKERGADKKTAAVDLLTSDELSRYERAESQIAVLVDLRMEYQQIKTALAGPAERRINHDRTNADH